MVVSYVNESDRAVFEMYANSGNIRIIFLQWIIALLFELDISSEISITGSGSSFPYEVYKLWQSSYTVFRQSFITLEMRYNPVGGSKAKEELYRNDDIQYASIESVISETEQTEHPDLVEFPVMAG